MDSVRFLILLHLQISSSGKIRGSVFKEKKMGTLGLSFEREEECVEVCIYLVFKS